MEIKQQSVNQLIAKELSERRGIEEIMKRFRSCVIVHALNTNHGSIRGTARLLKTNRNSLIRWMEEGNIDKHYPIPPPDRVLFRRSRADRAK
jgi:DNA-binding NtrC family response regulator